MKTLLFYYCLILTILLTLGAAFTAQTGSVIPLILFLPITVYFLSLILGKISGHRFSFPLQKPLSTLDLYYGFIVVTVMTISGLIGAKNIAQFLSGIIFLPLAVYFIFQVLPKRKHAVIIPTIVLQPKDLKQSKKQIKQSFSVDGPIKLPKIDVDRRQFLKLIGSAGISLFLFSVFTKKAEAAFFGSVPGPGTVAIKDIAGTQIDPAIKQPTDGYKINQVDDSDPAYYGFVNKDGDWFIMKEASGSYRYYKKKVTDGNFSDSWEHRGSLSPNGYFDAIF